jgi:hypothetical protein
MSGSMSRRLRKPGMIFVGGTALAAAWLIRGGQNSFSIAIIIEVTILISAAATYIRSGQDTEEGALAASERDERQQLINQRSWALAGTVAMVASFLGLTVAVAVNGAWWWPCAAIFCITGFAYLYGLSRFGVGEEGPAEDEDEPGGGAERPTGDTAGPAGDAVEPAGDAAGPAGRDVVEPAGDAAGPAGRDANSGYEARSPVSS